MKKGFKGADVHVGHAHPSAALLLAWRRRLTVKPPIQRSPLTHNNADLRFLCCSLGGSRSPTRAGSPQVFPPCPPWWCGGRGSPDVLAVIAQYISHLCLLFIFHFHLYSMKPSHRVIKRRVSLINLFIFCLDILLAPP